jgi:diguanylate cyclase (GGDEF)-like protein
VQTCENGEEAWDLLRTSTSIKIVFTDINMKGMNGLELLTNIRESTNSRIATIPVIMITGASDTEAAMRDVFEMGATDFIAKPFKTMDLMSRAYSYFNLSEKVSALEEQLGIDKLSGLYNKTSMNQHAAKFLAFAQRHNTPFSIAFVEIMQFEALLDKYGNKIAAQILTTVADRFKTRVRNEDVVARTGTARFAVLQPVCNSVRAQASINRVRIDIQNITFKLGNKSIRLSLAVGLTTSDASNAEQTMDDMYVEASQALSNAKQMNREYFSIFNNSSADKNTNSKADLMPLTESLQHIIEGNYDSINPEHLQQLGDTLNRFLSYIDSRQMHSIKP